MSPLHHLPLQLLLLLPLTSSDVISFWLWRDSSPPVRDSTDQQYGYRVYKDPPTFYSALDDFLAEDGKRFQSDIAFDENGAIAVSRRRDRCTPCTAMSRFLDANVRRSVSMSCQWNYACISPSCIHYVGGVLANQDSA